MGTKGVPQPWLRGLLVSYNALCEEEASLQGGIGLGLLVRSTVLLQQFLLFNSPV